MKDVFKQKSTEMSSVYSEETLLVINFVMDPSDPALSHQVEIVEALAENFGRVVVLTGLVNWTPTRSNIELKCSNWKEGDNLQNVLRFYKIFIKIWKEYDVKNVFSHMAVIQSGLVAPLIRICGATHVLWYAHAKDSLYLRWTAFWVNQIATSTKGSCPIRNPKVVYLGQSIKSENFNPVNRSASKVLQRIVHVGRNDRSKNIGLLIQTVSDQRQKGLNLTLDLYGEPSTSANRVYFAKLVDEWQSEIEIGWLKFWGAIPRHEVEKVLQNYDVFIHGYEGSLDKSLLEATLCNIPVVTVNSEYLIQFGSWSDKDLVSLENELTALLQIPKNELTSSLEIRRNHTLQNHGFKSWVKNLVQLFSES